MLLITRNRSAFNRATKNLFLFGIMACWKIREPCNNHSRNRGRINKRPKKVRRKNSKARLDKMR